MECKDQEHIVMEEEVAEPVSPGAQYFNSSALSVCILCVLELEIPFDDSYVMPQLRDVFLPINPRFSSIMVTDKNGVRQWKKVEVKLEDHVNVPIFPGGLSTQSYDDYFSDYLSRIASEELPQSRPLWEIHIFKFPTSNAAGNLIFKLHHALGDGYSLMGALLSCLHRVDDPSLPLSFPSLRSLPKSKSTVYSIFNTISDLGYSLLKSSFIEDDQSPVRSADIGVEFKSIEVSTVTFSLDHIKQIKAKLGVTVNDVVTGIIFYGTRLYMQAVCPGSASAETTAMVMLNTRMIGGYRSIKEMIKPDADSRWGNQLGFLHLPVPNLTESLSLNPVEFIMEVHKTIKKKRSSLNVKITSRLLDAVTKYRGSETTSKYIHDTLKNSSMVISNVIGPVEHMALANHPVRGLYVAFGGVPQSLTITMVSYMGNLRVAVGTEKDFIDANKFKTCIKNASEIILKATTN